MGTDQAYPAGQAKSRNSQLTREDQSVQKVEVSLIGKNNTIKQVNGQNEDRSSAFKAKMSDLRDNAQTDLDIVANEIQGATTSAPDISVNQHGVTKVTQGVDTSQSEAAFGGVKFNKDINLWNNNLQHPSSIDCNTVISMLDQTRIQYESLFHEYKAQRGAG